MPSFVRVCDPHEEGIFVSTHFLRPRVSIFFPLFYNYSTVVRLDCIALQLSLTWSHVKKLRKNMPYREAALSLLST